MPAALPLHICALQIRTGSPIRRNGDDTGLPSSTSRASTCAACLALPLMDRTPSKPRAALWMAGWLALMLIMAIAGRETTHELNVFQIMEVRSILSLFILYPLIRVNGGFAAMKDVAAAAAYRAQSHSLCRTALLVLRAHADSARPGGVDRIHHADLDRDPGCQFFLASA